MKATLVFNLNDQDDKAEYRYAMGGKDMYLFLWEWEQMLRSNAKYGSEPKSWDEVREKYYELKANYNIVDE